MSTFIHLCEINLRPSLFFTWGLDCSKLSNFFEEPCDIDILSVQKQNCSVDMHCEMLNIAWGPKECFGSWRGAPLWVAEPTYYLPVMFECLECAQFKHTTLTSACLKNEISFPVDKNCNIYNLLAIFMVHFNLGSWMRINWRKKKCGNL